MSLIVGMLTAMRFALDQAEYTEAVGTAGSGCGAAVCVEAVDVVGLSEEGLRSRIKSIGQAESKLAAMKSQAVAEMARQHNAVAAERIVREELQSSKRAARHDVKTAERLATLGATSEALATGDIPQDHARLIARASSDGPIDEQALVDAANRELANARLSDGTPLPMQELVRLALKADIFPAVFDAKTQNLWLGRSRRTATEAQRIALMVRDQGCIGCGAAPNQGFAHHVKFWKNGGPTDYPNLVLVCNDCHHDIHDHGFQTTQDPGTGRWKTQPPPEAFPDTGTSAWQPNHLDSVLLN